VWAEILLSRLGSVSPHKAIHGQDMRMPGLNLWMGLRQRALSRPLALAGKQTKQERKQQGVYFCIS